MDEVNGSGDDERNDYTHTFKNFICGDETLRIAPDQTYFLLQPMVIAILKMASFG